MRNSPEYINFNRINQSRREITNIIKAHWSNLLGCTVTDFDNGLNFIVDSKNPRLSLTKKIKEEVQVLNLKDGGTIINVSDECYEELQEIIRNYGVDDKKIGQLLQKKYKGVLSSYYSIRSYLFTDEKLQPVNPNVRKLAKAEKALFTSFMEKCSEQERNDVYMDFEATEHNFYAYLVDGEIVAVGEYFKIHDDDIIAIPSIITREDCRGKGYGKAVINVITHKIIEKGLVSQYRCDPENIGSRNLAKSLGYEEIIDGYSLSIEQE